MLTKETEKLIDAFGYLYKDEALLLQDVVKDLPERAICVNIGAGAGTSALAVIEKRPDLSKTFFTIDINEGNTPLGSLEGEKNAFDNAKIEKPWQILGDSKFIATTWNYGELDLLIIDGDHSYDGAKGDILGWEKHLKNGAFVFVHDYEAEVWPDVFTVVNELMLKNVNKYKLYDRASTYIVFTYIG